MISWRSRIRNVRHILKGNGQLRRTNRRARRTEIVVAQRLDNLRDEEESQLHGVLFQHTVSILEELRMVVVAPLKERDSEYRGNRSPQEKVLHHS